MNTAEQIILVINTLCEKFGIAIDWTAENITPYIETLCAKLIAYELWTSAATIAICVLLFTTSIVVAKKLSPIFKNRADHSEHFKSDWDFATGLLWTCVLVIAVACFVVVCSNIFDIIQCVTFPETFIFEYTQNLIATK